ncbi:hypothetical protein D9M69_669330 [compost metagenome]
MAAQVAFTRRSRLGAFAFIGQHGDIGQQRGSVGAGGCRRRPQRRNPGKRTAAHWRRRWIAQRLWHRQWRRNERRQGIRVRSSLSTEREGLRDTNRAHPQTPQQTAFGRADKQHAVNVGQALEHFED